MIPSRAALLSLLLLAPLPGRAAPAEAPGVGLTALLEAAILPQIEAQQPVGVRLEFMLPEAAPERAAGLIAVEHDLRAGVFAAVVETAEGGRQTLRGRVFAVVDALVPRRPILPGEVTRAEDFETRTLPAQGMGRHALSAPEQILGQEVRRTLPEGRAIQAQSLRAPRAVQRGEKLVLEYSQGALQLSAPARALEDAALGEAVKVQNLASNKTVIGRALGQGRVEVTQ